MQALADFLYEMLSEHGYIFRTLAQGRHHNMENIDAIVKVIPETALLHLISKVFGGGRQNPDIYIDGLGISYPLYLLLL